MKVLGVILGVILFIGGVQLAATPFETTVAVSSIVPIFLGASLTVTGIFKFIEWIQVKKLGGKDGLLFWEAVLAFIFGVFLLISWSFRTKFSIAFNLLIPIWAAAMILSSGVIRIIRAIQLKKFNETINTMIGGIKLSWGWELAFGILLIILGIMSCVNPFTTLIAVGILIGVNISVFGLTLVMGSLAM